MIPGTRDTEGRLLLVEAAPTDTDPRMGGFALNALGQVFATFVGVGLQKLLWPLGTEPGLWISPRSTSASYQDSAGTTALSAIGTVLDSANPVGAILDRRFGATAIADPGTHLLQATSAARPQASGRVNPVLNTEDIGPA